MRPHLLHPPVEAPSFPLEGGHRLDLRSCIGSGTWSTVHRAVFETACGLRRTVAAKIFGLVATDDVEEITSALALAAQRSAAVRHPNVVQTYDFVVKDRQPILLCELVEGVSLDALIRRQACAGVRSATLDLALFILTEIAEGLSGARVARDEDGLQIGLQHQGLSSREVLLSFRGEVKVEGFGLETLPAGTSSVRSLRRIASRAYAMAPEVALGDLGDSRSDVFSLGAIMRELLVGPRFPEGITDAETIRLARSGYVHDPWNHPHLPDELAVVIDRAMQLEPDDRYPNATAMAFELRRVAFAMGVGDGRYFLRRALDRVFGDGTNEATSERAG